MADRDQAPSPITWKPGDPIPELPDGYVWGYEITAEAEVVHADGTKE